MPRSRRRTTTAAPGAATPAAVVHAHLTLIETDDPLLLAEIRADPRVGGFIVALLDDRRAVIRPGAADTVARALLKAGHLPRIVE